MVSDTRGDVAAADTEADPAPQTWAEWLSTHDYHCVKWTNAEANPSWETPKSIVRDMLTDPALFGKKQKATIKRLNDEDVIALVVEFYETLGETGLPEWVEPMWNATFNHVPRDEVQFNYSLVGHYQTIVDELMHSLMLIQKRGTPNRNSTLRPVLTSQRKDEYMEHKRYMDWAVGFDPKDVKSESVVCVAELKSGKKLVDTMFAALDELPDNFSITARLVNNDGEVEFYITATLETTCNAAACKALQLVLEAAAYAVSQDNLYAILSNGNRFVLVGITQQPGTDVKHVEVSKSFGRNLLKEYIRMQGGVEDEDGDPLQQLSFLELSTAVASLTLGDRLSSALDKAPKPKPKQKAVTDAAYTEIKTPSPKGARPKTRSGR